MEPKQPVPPATLTSEDYYFEGEYLVFTAAYHRKRGYCCGSGCRHCPYDKAAAESPAQSGTGKGDDSVFHDFRRANSPTQM